MLTTKEIFEYVKNLLVSNYNISGNEIYQKDYVTQKKGNNPECVDTSVYFEKLSIFQIHYVNNIARLSFRKDFSKYFDNNDYYVMASNPFWIHTDVENMEKLQMLNDVFIAIVEDCAETNIGCCSRYKECSDNKKCVNPYSEIFLHCSYRKKLKDGIVYYGKNRNVDVNVN